MNGFSSGRIREAARCFHRGGIIAYPTEAVYGLGCDPLDGAAVYRLLDLKQRPVEKGLILIAARFGQLRPYVGEVDEERLRPALESWPGPHTWLLPAAPGLPVWLSGSHDTLAGKGHGASSGRSPVHGLRLRPGFHQRQSRRQATGA